MLVPILPISLLCSNSLRTNGNLLPLSKMAAAMITVPSFGYAVKFTRFKMPLQTDVYAKDKSC